MSRSSVGDCPLKMAPRFNFIFLVLLCVFLPKVSNDESRTLNSTGDARELLISSRREGLLRQVHEASSSSSSSSSPLLLLLPSIQRCYRLPRPCTAERKHKRALKLLPLRAALRPQSDPEALQVSRAAEVFHAGLQVLQNTARRRSKRGVTATGPLSREDVAPIAELSKCPPPTHPASCLQSHVTKYRSISGLCNNRQNPLWGAANTPLVRWLPAEYEDGAREPKGWNRGRLHNGFQLPPPWEVSQKIIRSATKETDGAYSHLLVEWGQYIDHDVTFTPQSKGRTPGSAAGSDCSAACRNAHPCFPIQTGAPTSGAPGCMPFHRSAPACPARPGAGTPRARQRQQLNAITSFIDASLVYGHTPRRQALLRDLSGLDGKLAVSERFRDPEGRAYPPPAPASAACRQGPGGDAVECFSAGDGRANEGLPLACLHTLWLREHNRIAGELRRVNAHWSPETLYQESRRIVGALHQIITMRDYVPKILGRAAFDHHVGPYRGYDPTADPSASNVFATAAFRFGHATIPPVLRRLNESFQTHQRFGDLRLHETFFSPWRIVKEGGIEPILRGAFGTAASAGSANMLLTEEITERLVVLDMPRPMDLASLNLQRGRDHALPGYNDWRSFCGLERIEEMEGFKKVVGDHRVAEKMARVYKHPDNVDVWLGGLVEHMTPGSRTGPLFACLIGKQMKALRDGDRFWWEAEGVFSQLQRAQLLKGSLSRIICDNSGIREVPPDPFRFGKYPYDYISCDHIPSIDLEAWKEETNQDMEQCGIPRTIKNGDFILSPTNGKLVALYSCYHGFKLKGAAAVVCQGNQWSDQPPQCTGNHR